MERRFDADHYDVVAIEWIESYEGFEWESPKEQDEYDALAERAVRLGGVVYGTFFVYAEE